MYGRTIEYFRINKGLTIFALTDGIMTRASYYRFTRNQSDTKVEKFFNLLERLRVEPTEFFIVHNNFQTYTLPSLAMKVKKVVTIQEFYILSSVKILANLHLNKHDSMIINEFIRLKKHFIENQKNISSFLKMQLIQTDSWTSYELMMFSHSMRLFDSFLMDRLLSKIIHRRQKYYALSKFKREAIFLIIDAILIYFERNEPHYVKHWLAVARKQLPFEDYLSAEIIISALNTCYLIRFEKRNDLLPLLTKHITYTSSLNAPFLLNFLKNILFLTEHH